MNRRALDSPGGAIPVLSLVDTLFAAFAAILVTAAIVIVFIRSRTTDEMLPALPLSTLVVDVRNFDSTCHKQLRLSFEVTHENWEQPVHFDLGSQRGGAMTDAASEHSELRGWFMAQTSNTTGWFDADAFGNGEKFMRAELILVRAPSGILTVTPKVVFRPNSNCPQPDAPLIASLSLGPLDSKPARDKFLPVDIIPPIKIEVRNPV